MEKGIVSGNPVVDLEVEVFFGAHHAVDSSEAAFRIAGAAAFRKAFHAARPSLLEPIVDLEITAPLAKFGEIAADLATRRGQIAGMEALPGGLQSIRAIVPLAEAPPLRHRPQEPDRRPGHLHDGVPAYEPAPTNVQQSVVDRWARSRAGIDED